MASLVVLLVLFVGCYTLPAFLPYSYTDLDYTALLQPPNTRHWLGTNALGQDLLAQTLRGMQKSMLIGVAWQSFPPASPRQSGRSRATSAAGATGC